MVVSSAGKNDKYGSETNQYIGIQFVIIRKS